MAVKRSTIYRSSDVMAALNGTENEKAFISEELYENCQPYPVN